MKCELCRNIVDILNGPEMIRYRNSSKWEERVLPEAGQMSDEGGGHKAFVTNDRPGSMLLKCYQHCGSEYYCYVFDLCFALFVFVLTRMVAGPGAELAYDKNLHKKLFDGEVEYERFIGICGMRL